MKLTPVDIARLESFLERIADDTYPEPPSDQHERITEGVLEKIVPIVGLAPGARVLDVGCGQGVALRHFQASGWDATGITLNATDVEACRARGYHVLEMDQSFLDFPGEHFDLVWCRHCLEHSVFPYFTLTQFWRVLKPGGWLYVEVPAPDTACAHQTNPNHYSVMGKSMLASLMQRSGFSPVESFDIGLNVPAGPDVYWGFVQRRL